MKKVFNFPPVRLWGMSILSCILFFAAIPRTAMLKPQPLVVIAPNYFSAEYMIPTLQFPTPIESDKPHTMAASNYSLQGDLKSSISQQQGARSARSEADAFQHGWRAPGRTSRHC